jgi:ATP-dependent DNA helicase DinG
VPEAVLTLKQGLGRLIRSTSDRGVLAVLDSRLVERPYGRRFLASLPPARLVHDLEEARAVFD